MAMSQRDAAVLDFLCNPHVQSPQHALHTREAAQSGSGRESDGAEAALAAAAGARTPTAGETRAMERARLREMEAVQLAENGRVQESIAVLTAVIEELPAWASAYNNRAQARYLAGDAAGARRDVDAALALWEAWAGDAAPKAASGDEGEDGDEGALPGGVARDALLPVCGDMACKAYTQRALLRGADKDEEGARRDMERAATMGSLLARQKLAAENPYATLCSNMVTMMMEEAVGAAPGQGAPAGDRQ